MTVRRPIPLMQRAFEIARSGELRTFNEICDRLAKEGYDRCDMMGIGPSTRRQLNTQCKLANGKAKP